MDMRILVATGTILLIAGCVSSQPNVPGGSSTSATTGGPAPVRESASAELHRIAKTGSLPMIVGWANFTETGQGLRIDIELRGSGLNATDHGLHIHANGDCGSNGTTAGSKAGAHFNPDNKTHGNHAGDLGNLGVTTGGDADLVVLANSLHAPLTLRAGAKYSIAGRSIVIHDKADDGKTDPSGNSGARVVCGVLKAPPLSTA
jgi:Cu-Zn family superoxide dismutase